MNKKKHPAQDGLKAVLVGILANVLLAVFKAAVGILGHSYAMIADALESTTDILSSIIVLAGLRITMLKPDENHPYGHGKAEPMAAIIVSVVMFAIASIVLIQGIFNILGPKEMPEPFTLIFLAMVIVVKEAMYQYLGRRAKQTNSVSVQADAAHHRSDAISSIAAFVGISIAIFAGEGYEAADDWAAIVAAGIIFYNSYSIFKPAFDEVMDVAPPEEYVAEVRRIAETVTGVIEIEKCKVRKMGFDYFVDIHVVVDGNITVAEGHQLGHFVKDKIMEIKPSVLDVLTHIEPHIKPYKSENHYKTY